MKLFDPFFSFFINLFKLCFGICSWCYGFWIGWLFEEVCGNIWHLRVSNFVVCLRVRKCKYFSCYCLTIFCVLTLLVNTETKTHLRCIHIKKNICDEVYWFACLCVYDFCMCVILFRSYFVSIVIYFGNLYIEFCFLLQEEEMFRVMTHISREGSFQCSKFKVYISKWGHLIS